MVSFVDALTLLSMLVVIGIFFVKMYNVIRYSQDGKPFYTISAAFLFLFGSFLGFVVNFVSWMFSISPTTPQPINEVLYLLTTILFSITFCLTIAELLIYFVFIPGQNLGSYNPNK